MSIMSMANSLMLDFRCIIIPRFVYSDDDKRKIDETNKQRLNQLALELKRFVMGLSNG